MSRIAVLGAGSWGSALAILLARNGHAVALWDHFPDHIGNLIADGENRRFLPGIAFPAGIEPSAELAYALKAVEIVLIVVPSHAFRSILLQAAPHLPGQAIISWAAKGLEPGCGRLLSQVAIDVLGPRDVAVVSGPTFAAEVARGLPTAITVASTDAGHASRVAGCLHGESFRAYTSTDVIGVQIGGAVKNVMAIAAGIADGLGFGANARAALITRGLAEILRLGLALGGHADTFMGLAGLGDLVLTCTDNQSRNRRMGLALAAGKGIDQARMEIGQEVEGVGTTREVYRLANSMIVDMPITTQVYRVLYQGLSPDQAVHNLLGRKQKAESDRESSRG
ncbi:MAG: NAD(P)-dependent glycerol-3-phosphate dehydrogenase [Gammaproteobacteria bacterium]|nr:NAD(P)-dependent glycerol-3-phosphate dehydrogenase [Gammaproteobacteria bacterium]MBU1656246.1 NAD(P)-dependent glycerol-3-phosphate dehydrogenase [Gammaproteobacteria bacterium]MBU1959811.1 NAD(P)-dependent glycerol-3-phosphate dehydrogenase [Gammaproteobacteria bacterium]